MSGGSGVDVVRLVQSYANVITPKREYDTILKSIVEEVGELATEIAVAQGTKKRPPSPDGVKGESIDVFITAVDMMCKAWGDGMSSDEFVTAVTKKLEKWKSFSDNLGDEGIKIEVSYGEATPVITNPPKVVKSFRDLVAGDVLEFKGGYGLSNRALLGSWKVGLVESHDYQGPFGVQIGSMSANDSRRPLWIDFDEHLRNGDLIKVNGGRV